MLSSCMNQTNRATPRVTLHASRCRTTTARARSRPQPAARSRRLTIRAAFEDQDAEAIRSKQAAMKAEYDAAMADPAQAEQIKQLQATMADPGMQQQMAGVSAMMNDPKMKETLMGLKDDPEMKDFFEAIKTQGPAALGKYWNDPEFLQKFAERVQPAVSQNPAMQAAAEAAAGSGGAAPPAPEVNDLLDAAKYGDMEAVEDFIAIGKDVNMKDDVGRTPLHFAVAYDHNDITTELLANKADVNPVDSKDNTPLHYAAGYGREAAVALLLDAGADVSVQNSTGKTAADLAKLDERNPLSKNAELLARMEA